MADYQVETIQEIIVQVSPDRLSGVGPAVNTVIGIALMIGFLVIFQSMYTAVKERTREIGILKALGASRGYIVAVILRETGMLAAGGILLGVGLSFVVREGIVTKFPTLAFEITLHWPFWGRCCHLEAQ